MIRKAFLLLPGLLLSACVGVHYGMTTAYSYIAINGGAGMGGTFESMKYQDAKKCTYSVFRLFAFGDASVEEVMRTKGLKKAVSVSYEIDPKLGFNQAVCVIVRGY